MHGTIMYQGFTTKLTMFNFINSEIFNNIIIVRSLAINKLAIKYINGKKVDKLGE